MGQTHFDLTKNKYGMLTPLEFLYCAKTLRNGGMQGRLTQWRNWNHSQESICKEGNMEKIEVIKVLMEKALSTRGTVDYITKNPKCWATDDPEQQKRIMKMWNDEIDAFETAAAMLVAG